jgi:hypothetical protein
MKLLWTRRSASFELEQELRANRPRTRPEFLAALGERVRREPARHGRGALRIAFAGGLTALLFAALASVGGFAYAASSLGAAVTEVQSAIASGPTTVTSSSADDQYRPGKGCGDKNHEHEREWQCKIVIHNVSKQEGNSGQTAFAFDVDLNDFAIDPVVVSFATAEGTATPVIDYTPTTGVLTFDPGMSSQTITVAVIGDTVREPDETFVMNLFDASANAVIDTSQGVGTIINDD